MGQLRTGRLFLEIRLRPLKPEKQIFSSYISDGGEFVNYEQLDLIALFVQSLAIVNYAPDFRD